MSPCAWNTVIHRTTLIRVADEDEDDVRTGSLDVLQTVEEMARYLARFVDDDDVELGDDLVRRRGRDSVSVHDDVRIAVRGLQLQSRKIVRRPRLTHHGADGADVIATPEAVLGFVSKRA